MHKRYEVVFVLRRTKITSEKYSDLVEWALNARLTLVIKNLKGHPSASLCDFSPTTSEAPM